MLKFAVFLSEKKCMKEYKLAIRNYIATRFVPQCNRDGSYSPVQCGPQWSSCWCVDRNGKRLKGTETKGWPSCRKLFCLFSDSFY